MKLTEIYNIFIKEYTGNENCEPETLLEASGLTIDETNINYFKCFYSLKKLKELDDYVAFEKITMALSGKPVDFEEAQEPFLPEVLLAYVFTKNKVKLSDEVIKYIASICIHENLLCVPGDEDVNSFIRKYLSINFPHLLLKIPKIEKGETTEDEMINEQLDKLKEINEYIQTKI